MQTYPFLGCSEPISCFTHLIGALVFAYLSLPLLRKSHGSFGRFLCLGVFTFSCIFLLTMSGTYHLLTPGGSARDVLQRLDHAAIFVLIAGTFTPVHSLLFHGISRWGMLVFVWTAAIVGLTLKTIYFEEFPEWLGLSFYLVLGWVGVFSVALVWKRFQPSFLKPLLFGALAYTIGSIFEFFHIPIIIAGVLGPHEIFHIAVLIGIGYHWRFIFNIAAHEESLCLNN